MDEALNRHGEHLKRIEDEKTLQESDFRWRIQAEQDIQ